jgi:2-haloacid dehalogenase
MTQYSVKVLAFDVFGTVVDVRSSLIREMKQFGLQTGIDSDWEAFALQWIFGGYAGGVAGVNAAVRQDPSKWRSVHELIRTWLDENLPNVQESDKDRLCYAWHRLTPWDDTLSGMQRLRTRFQLVTLANASVSLLSDIAYHAALPWYKILSAEAVRIYKTEHEVYEYAVASLGILPGEIMMVAAHKPDLKAASNAGFQTAFVDRPGENDGDNTELTPTVTAEDFNDLAAKLGA